MIKLIAEIVREAPVHCKRAKRSVNEGFGKEF